MKPASLKAGDSRVPHPRGARVGLLPEPTRTIVHQVTLPESSLFESKDLYDKVRNKENVREKASPDYK